VLFCDVKAKIKFRSVLLTAAEVGDNFIEKQNVPDGRLVSELLSDGPVAAGSMTQSAAVQLVIITNRSALKMAHYTNGSPPLQACYYRPFSDRRGQQIMS